MPLLSAFTPCGMLTLSRLPSHGETVYRSLAGQFTDSGISATKGTREDCTAYAQAMGLARARYTIEKAGNQLFAHTVSDLIDQREEEYGLVPTPSATMHDRRAAIAAAKLLPGGAGRNNLENALRTLLGSSFVDYRTVLPSDVSLYPTLASDSPNAFKLPSVPSKVVALAADVCVDLTGGPQAVGYSKIALPSHPDESAASNYIRRGDVLVVDAGRAGLEERVTVTAATSTTFSANFGVPHSAGALCTTQPWPRWTSNQRTAIIVVTAAAADDPDIRQSINDLMDKLERAVSTWAIVESGGSVIGPFQVGTSNLGATTAAQITIP